MSTNVEMNGDATARSGQKRGRNTNGMNVDGPRMPPASRAVAAGQKRGRNVQEEWHRVAPPQPRPQLPQFAAPAQPFGPMVPVAAVASPAGYVLQPGARVLPPDLVRAARLAALSGGGRTRRRNRRHRRPTRRAATQRALHFS